MKAAISPITVLATLVFAIFLMTGGIYAQRTKAVSRGTWGGPSLNMTVTSTGATLQFDCADGEITKQLRMTKNGSFAALGTFMRSGPGPIRVDRQPEARSVTYKGKVKGKTMSLSITDTKTGEDLGTFKLGLGQSGRIHRCY